MEEKEVMTPEAEATISLVNDLQTLFLEMIAEGVNA